MEPKDKSDQRTDSELIGVQSELDLHTEVIHDMLPFMPPDVQAKVQAKLGEQKRIEHDHALHNKVDGVASDVLDVKSVLSDLKGTIDALANVVAGLAVKTPEKKEPVSNPPANPTENKDTKEAPKDDKEPREPGKDNAPAKSPTVEVKDTPMYLTVRKRGGRTRTILATRPRDLAKVNKLMLKTQGKTGNKKDGDKTDKKDGDKTDHEYR